MLTNLVGRLSQHVRKPVLFGAFGAAGCLILALAGELLLAVAMPKVQPQSKTVGIDVLFVLDVTGSMRPELQGVVQGVRGFVEGLSARSLNGRVGLLAFGDELNGDAPQVLAFTDGPFTSNPEDFSTKLAKVQLTDGGDAPETSYEAIVSAASQPFRADATRVLVLITDAPPHTERTSLSKVEQSLVQGRIDQLHLVVQPSDRDWYEDLQHGAPGETFAIGEVADSRQGFDQILIRLGHRIAERTVQSLVSRGQFSTADAPRLWITLAVWTGLISLGVSLALIVVQQCCLRRGLSPIAVQNRTIIQALAAGMFAGAVGQLLQTQLSTALSVASVGRGLGWALLGLLVGRGMSRIVPNLPRRQASWGGLVGGTVGAVAFMLTEHALGETAGRLIGASVLGGCIGTMVAWVEELSREACLVVHWSPNEQTVISLGEHPVVLGSSPEAHVYLAKDRGFPAVAGLISFISGQVEFENKMNSQNYKLRSGSKLQLGGVVLEIQTA